MPYIADIGVGLYIFKHVNEIVNPADVILKNIMLIQKTTVVLNSLVMTDVFTKAMMLTVPAEVINVIDNTLYSIYDYIMNNHDDINVEL
jgi:hypothetical protein